MRKERGQAIITWPHQLQHQQHFCARPFKYFQAGASTHPEMPFLCVEQRFLLYSADFNIGVPSDERIFDTCSPHRFAAPRAVIRKGGPVCIYLRKQ